MPETDWFDLFDAHMHYTQAYLPQVLESFGTFGLCGTLNLWGDGSLGYTFDYAEFLGLMMRQKGHERHVQFYWPAWKEFGWRPRVFVGRLVSDMHRYHALGCRGLKVWKDMGMFNFHTDGRPVTMDDPHLKPVWNTAADLGWIVAIHQADPSRNWPWRTKIAREELFQRRDAVIGAHPEITFILCHNGNDVESIAGWADLMERLPNTLSDMNRDPMKWGARQEVLGFLDRYADRIMFSTDLGSPTERPPDIEWCLEHIYRPWRQRLRQWGLRDETFRKITRQTAEKLLLR